MFRSLQITGTTDLSFENLQDYSQFHQPDSAEGAWNHSESQPKTFTGTGKSCVPGQNVAFSQIPSRVSGELNLSETRWEKMEQEEREGQFISKLHCSSE